MKKTRTIAALSRRERQIMDVVYRLGRATAADVTRELPDAPSYTTVRGLLRILVEKEQLRFESDGQRYVYYPAVARETAGVTLLSHVVRTFFQGSTTSAMAALLDADDELTESDANRLRAIIEHARRNEV